MRVGDDTPGALATADGGAVASEIVSILESELVRFCHRVEHDHAIAIDRARASMVLLGTLVGAGAAWTARGDSSPARIHDAFAELAGRHDADWAPAETIRREVAAFLEATAAVQIVDEPARTPAALLRKAGSDPDLWWWAAEHDTPERCWAACGEHGARLVQVALALGLPSERVARAIATTLAGAAGKAKTKRVVQRDDLVLLLTALNARGARALDESRPLIAQITKLAFETAAAQQSWWHTTDRSGMPGVDGIAEIAVIAFQLVALFERVTRPPDLERYGELAARADAMFHRRGMRFAALIRAELDGELSGRKTPRP